MAKNRPPLLFAGSSQTALAEEIAQKLGVPLGRVALDRFPDGESSVEILEDVRGREVFVLQSTALDPSFYLLELLIMIDALKRSSAKHIVAIIPYFGYCRQDRKDKPGVPITAKLIANMLTAAGITRVITIDLHAGQLEGFFEVPVDHLHCQALLAEEARKFIKNDYVVVAPDVGSIKIAEKMAKFLKTNLILIEKQRLSASEVKMNLIGELKAQNVLLIDDICSTAGTLVAAAELCKQHGAQKIVAAVTHAICSDHAIKKIEDSAITSFISTNSVPTFERFAKTQKMRIISIANLLADAIKHLLDDYNL